MTQPSRDRTCSRRGPTLKWSGVHGGLSWKQASERLAGLASPELYHLLTVELGWTPRQHRDWLVGVVDTEVLGTPRDGTGHFSA